MSLIVLTSVGASIGAPATPGVEIVIFSMVLSSVDIPLKGIALIMGVDRILDIARTANNVAGDLVAAKMIDTTAGGQLTRREELIVERKQQFERKKTGEDVIISVPSNLNNESP